MLGTQLHWVNGPWTGHLALAARPRGGDWLGDEMAGWHRAGVDMIVSFLERDEERDLDLLNEGREAQREGMDFRSIPIPDREVPTSRAAFETSVEALAEELSSGKNVLLHCRQGVGRTGMTAVCLMVARGVDPEEAIRTVSAARGVPVPETEAQREWIAQFSLPHAVAR